MFESNYAGPLQDSAVWVNENYEGYGRNRNTQSDSASDNVDDPLGISDDANE